MSLAIGDKSALALSLVPSGICRRRGVVSQAGRCRLGKGSVGFERGSMKQIIY